MQLRGSLFAGLMYVWSPGSLTAWHYRKLAGGTGGGGSSGPKFSLGVNLSNY